MRSARPNSTRRPGRPKVPGLELRRRTEILDAAAGLFAKNGFSATDVQVLADHLGIGKGTIYRYFRTKEQLFLATVERGLDELTAEIDAVMADPVADPIDLIRKAIRAYLGFFNRRPEMAELFIQERAAFPLHHRPLYFSNKDDDEKCCQRIELMNRLIEAGRVRPMPMERFFNVIGDLLYGIILTNLLTGRPADPNTQTDDVLDVVFHGILTDAERKRVHKRKKR